MNALEVCGGTSIIHKSLQAFLPQSVATTVVIDMHGYDGFPALAALEASWETFVNHESYCG